MIPDLTGHNRWKLLTTKNIRLMKAWPCGRSNQRVLAAKELGPAPVRDFIVAFDYGGEHKGATHMVYVYLVVATGLNSWSRRMARLRKGTFGARTMAYKSLSDSVRQAALTNITIDNIGAQYMVRELPTGFGPPVLEDGRGLAD